MQSDICSKTSRCHPGNGYAIKFKFETLPANCKSKVAFLWNWMANPAQLTEQCNTLKGALHCYQRSLEVSSCALTHSHEPETNRSMTPCIFICWQVWMVEDHWLILSFTSEYIYLMGSLQCTQEFLMHFKCQKTIGSRWLIHLSGSGFEFLMHLSNLMSSMDYS